MVSSQLEFKRTGAGIEGIQITLCCAGQQGVLIEPFETEGGIEEDFRVMT